MLEHCILCGAESSLRVEVCDFDIFHCPECNEEFTVADLEARIGKMSLAVKCCKAARAVLEAESVEA